jgi:serine/threonine-protein kinase
MTDEQRIQELLDELLDSDATPEQVCASYPELMAVVRDRWQQIRRLRDNLDALFPEDSPPPEGSTLPQIPGYDAEAVLGCGGMGIVFRAKHLRLNRRVAVKMLLAGAYAAAREKERFQREAEAVAALRHPNIVQVYDVGEHEGRPYFTMELVEGGSLAKALAGTPQPTRKAAEMVATLAGAVHAAHASGIVHRDLKPSNILLTADGTPKITDFGLARRLDDVAGLTQTGVALGTPSYMAPEQALGQTDAVGPAVDVYALGAILYELVTGRPPFRAATAAETVQQVISQEPAAPSRLNDKIPRDLETICLRCLHKEPRRRYESAAALADDLKRFLDGRPIQARPVGRVERVWRWCRRNPMAAALLAAALVLLALAIGGGLWFVQARAERKAEATQRDKELRNEVATSVAQAASLRKGYHFGEARELLEQARQRLESAGPDDLRRLVEWGRADLDLAERLDDIRIQGSAPIEGRYDPSWVEPRYGSVFAETGLGSVGDDIEVVAARVRGSAVREEIVAALDDWASITPDRDRRDWLLKVAAAADPHPARDRLRQSGLWDNRELWKDPEREKQLTEELREAELSPQLATTLYRIGRASGGDGVKLLTVVQTRFPQDFWLNYALGMGLAQARRWDEALGYLRTTVALRPKASATHYVVGRILYDMRRVDESIGYLREALRLDKKYVRAHGTLAEILYGRGRRDEAYSHLQEALSIEPTSAEVHVVLSRALHAMGRLDEALEYCHRAVQLDPKSGAAHQNLGRAFAERRDWARAADGYARALKHRPTDDGHFWFEYAALLVLSGDRSGYEKACAHMIEKCGKAVWLRSYHVARACTLTPDAGAEPALPGRLAEKELRTAAKQFWSLTEQGALAYRAGRFQDAVPLFEESLKADSTSGRSVLNWLWLALANHRLGRTEEAHRWRLKAQAFLELYRDGPPVRAEVEIELHFHNWLEAHVLRREAEALIASTKP